MREYVCVCIEKVEEVQKQIKDLQRVVHVLQDLQKRCPDEKALYECPMIEMLIEEEFST